MLQIKNTLGGGKSEGLYAWSKNSVGMSDFKVLDKSVSTLPYPFYYSSAVVYNGEIHILGSGDSGYEKYHYKWDGSSWTSASTLPYSFNFGSVVVLNGEVHILGSYIGGSQTKHYKWDGSSWTSVSTLPYSFYYGSAVVYENEIHILGGDSGRTKHYKWDGSSWISVSTLPYNFYEGSAVVLNGEIHILGGSASITSHYKWDGSSWTSVSTLPYSFYYGSAVVYENEIHILGTYRSGFRQYYYKWDGSSWISVSTLPYNFYNGYAVVFDNGIYAMGGKGGNTKHYLIIGRFPVYTFIDYIVSDKESAYPDDAVHTDGYYYKNINGSITAKDFGFAKMTYGTFVPSSNTKSLSVVHNLGEELKRLIVLKTEENNESPYKINNLILRRGGASTHGGGSASYGSHYNGISVSISASSGSYSDATDDGITFTGYIDLNFAFADSTDVYFAKGETYYWIALA